MLPLLTVLRLQVPLSTGLLSVPRLRTPEYRRMLANAVLSAVIMASGVHASRINWLNDGEGRASAHETVGRKLLSDCVEEDYWKCASTIADALLTLLPCESLCSTAEPVNLFSGMPADHRGWK